MSLKARLKFLQIKKQLSPTRDFKRTLQRDLSKVWDAEYGSTPWYQVGALYKVGAVAVVVLILAGGGGAFAYSSPSVTEGTVLYPVKKAIEKVEEITKFTPEAKAKFYLKTIERREAEKEQLQKAVMQNVKQIRNTLSDAVTNFKERSHRDGSTGTENQTEPKFGQAQKVKTIESKIEKTEASLEKAEEQLERFNKIINKFESQEQRLRPEVQSKIESRLEKRKQRLENVSESMRDRKGESDESTNRIIELPREKFDSRDGRVRVELRERGEN